MRAALLAAVLLASLAPASRYDPDADRAALRQSAEACRASVTDAAALPLDPDNAAAIAARLDEGLRLSRLASAAAASLGAAARERSAGLDAGVKAALDDALKAPAEPVEAERRRHAKLSAELAELREKVEKLPKPEREKLEPLLDKAARALRAAASALEPLDAALAAMAGSAGTIKEARRRSLGPAVEVSSAAASVVLRAEELPAALAEAKERLGALAQEPRAAARSRAWEKLERARDLAGFLFRSADSACNRADEFRRDAAPFDAAFEAFTKARAAAAAGPGEARARLDEARELLARVGEGIPKR